MAISDIFIMDRNGLPYLARCYAGKSCKTNPEHTLLTGFFAAISSFSIEFDQEHLVSVEFDSLKLLFHHFENKIVVVGVENTSYEEHAVQLANEIRNKLKQNRYRELTLRHETLDDESEFIEWLDGKVQKNAMGNFTEKLVRSKRSLFQRLKNLF
ncbi:MAG: hypothetical protein D6732_29595 [Methanobacteriota archaeon]|nr:MAG: hypothetical protein D6732_29595 [Euryarchaeota archaeon]